MCVQNHEVKAVISSSGQTMVHQEVSEKHEIIFL